jgi:PAS domain S-box-containing protein
MSNPSDQDNNNQSRHEIIGFGERLLGKSHYSELRRKLDQLEEQKASPEEKTRALQALMAEVESERRKTAASEASYRRVIENIQDVFYRSDAQGHIVMASPSVLALLGYDSCDDLLGKPIADTFYFDSQKRTELLRLLQERGNVSNYEVLLKKKDGSPVLVETNSHLYHDEAGNIAGVEGTFRDMTARKQAEEARRESDRRLSDIIDFLPDATMAIDEHKRVIIWNRAIEEMSAIPAAEMIGQGGYAYAVPFYGVARPLLMDFFWESWEDISARYPILKKEGDNPGH